MTKNLSLADIFFWEAGQGITCLKMSNVSDANSCTFKGIQTEINQKDEINNLDSPVSNHPIHFHDSQFHYPWLPYFVVNSLKILCLKSEKI